MTSLLLLVVAGAAFTAPDDLVLYPNAAFDSHTAIQRLIGRDGKVTAEYPELHAYRVQVRNDLALKSIQNKTASDGFRLVRAVERGAALPTLAMESVRGLAKARMEAEARGDEEEADWYGARQYYISRRAFPYDVVDWKAIQRASQARDLMPVGRLGRTGGNAAMALGGTPILSHTWQYVGPRNFVNSQGNIVGAPPTTGRVNAAAFDPVDTNIVYACTAGGGVWKTTNGGANWIPLSDNWPTLATSSIAIDPTNRNRIFVGTGDVPGQLSRGAGMMRSLDGGATWSRLSLDSRVDGINSIVILPYGKSTVILATVARGHYAGQGIYRSTDNGDTWALNTSGSFSLAVSAPYNKQGRRYVFAYDMSGRWVYRSSDYGLTWDRFQTERWAFGDASAIACSTRDARTLYAMQGTRYSGRTLRGKIYKSTNAGQDWTDITSRFLNGDGDSAWGQPDYNYFLACSSLNGRDVVYLGLISAFVSLDGGDTWQDLGRAYTSSPTTHADQHCGVVNPRNPNQVLIGNDGGLVRYDLNSTTLSFTNTNVNGNTNSMLFYQVAVDPSRPDFMIGGAQDNGSPRVTGDLAAWRSVNSGDGAYCAVNPAHPDTQFSCSQYLAVSRTSDAWSSGEFIGPSLAADDHPAFIAPIELDPNDPNTLYAGAGHLHRWDDETRSWSVVTTTMLNTSSYTSPGISAIAVAPGNSNVIYAGTANGRVFMSEDRGANWRDIYHPYGAVSGLSISRSDPFDLLVSTSSTSQQVSHCLNTHAEFPVFQSASGVGPGLPTAPANTIVRDPYDWVRTWYLGTDVGVFVSEDAGATWANATAPLGLPNVQVNDLEIGLRTRMLNAATYGRGIWRVSLSRPPLRILGQLLLHDFSPISPTPDPAILFRDPKTRFVFDTQTVKLGSGGEFSLEDVPYMGFQVSVQFRSFLRKTANVSPFGPNGFTKLELVNGDVDGSNAIDQKDVDSVGALLGLKLGEKGYVDRADVNGDGIIDSVDLQVVKDNLGAVGDL